MVGLLPKARSPDISHGSTLRVDLSKDDSLGYHLLSLFCVPHQEMEFIHPSLESGLA